MEAARGGGKPGVLQGGKPLTIPDTKCFVTVHKAFVSHCGKKSKIANKDGVIMHQSRKARRSLFRFESCRSDHLFLRCLAELLDALTAS